MTTTASNVDAQGADKSATAQKSKKDAKAPGGGLPDPVAELEKRNLQIDDRLQKLAGEQKDLLAKKRANAAEIVNLKEKRLADFVRSTDLASFSPEVWKAAQAEIHAALAKVASQR